MTDIPARWHLRSGTQVHLSTFEDGDSPPAKKARRFKMIANTGKPVMTPFGKVVFDLQGLEAPAVHPILLNHDQSRIGGMSDKVAIGDSLEVEGVLFDNPTGHEIGNLSDQDFPWQASMHVEVGELEILLKDEKLSVNNREVVGPMIVARQNRLKENSFCALGADDDTAAVALSDGPTIELPPKTAEGGMSEEVAPATVVELTNAFPDEDKFVLDQLKAGHTLSQAHGDYNKVLKVRLSEKDTKVKELEVKLAAPNVGGSGSSQGGAQGADDPIEAYNLRKTQLMKGGMTRWQATESIARHESELHEAYLQAFNGGVKNPLKWASGGGAA